MLLPYLGDITCDTFSSSISPYLKKKISVSQIIKSQGAVVIFILILPFILWKSGYYGENKLFADSDTLRLLWSRDVQLLYWEFIDI